MVINIRTARLGLLIMPVTTVIVSLVSMVYFTPTPHFSRVLLLQSVSVKQYLNLS